MQDRARFWTEVPEHSQLDRGVFAEYEEPEGGKGRYINKASCSSCISQAYPTNSKVLPYPLAGKSKSRLEPCTEKTS